MVWLGNVSCCDGNVSSCIAMVQCSQAPSCLVAVRSRAV